MKTDLLWSCKKFALGRVRSVVIEVNTSEIESGESRMSLLSWFRDLFRHMRWADAVVWRSVLELSDAEGDARLHGLLYHIHLTQDAFLQVWSDLPPKFPEQSEFRSLAAICAWGRAYHEKSSTFIEGMDESKLHQPAVVPWAKEFVSQQGQPPKPTTLAETIVQVTSHSTYHRGQVNARLRELHGDPPLVDFIAWLWLGKPDETWPDHRLG